MNGEYMSLETAKKIVEMQKQIDALTKSALQLDRIAKEKQQRIDRAIEILDIYGTSNYETADLLYSALRKGDKEQ